MHLAKLQSQIHDAEAELNQLKEQKKILQTVNDPSKASRATPTLYSYQSLLNYNWARKEVDKIQFRDGPEQNRFRCLREAISAYLIQVQQENMPI